MEKRVAHYDLALAQADVARLGVAAFTKAALDGGRAMGLMSAENAQRDRLVDAA
jgi:motility quorum-sensing regulator/GCU-specific mRNA interferase toxin